MLDCPGCDRDALTKVVLQVWVNIGNNLISSDFDNFFQGCVTAEPKGPSCTNDAMPER